MEMMTARYSGGSGRSAARIPRRSASYGGQGAVVTAARYSLATVATPLCGVFHTLTCPGTRRAGRRAFTLIELLVVMGIIGIIMLIAMPVFTGIGRGANMRTAVTQLRTTMSLARQWAITKREDTYVVFPNDNSALYAPPYQAHANKALRAYNVYTKSEGYLRDWTYLPQGILFINNQGHEFNSEFPLIRDTKIIFSSDPAVNNAKVVLGFPDTNRQVEVRAVTFRPDGSVIGGLTPEIYVSEGWCTVDTNSGAIGSVEYKPRGQRMVMSVDITQLTGQFRVRITISEARVFRIEERGAHPPPLCEPWGTRRRGYSAGRCL